MLRSFTRQITEFVRPMLNDRWISVRPSKPLDPSRTMSRMCAAKEKYKSGGLYSEGRRPEVLDSDVMASFLAERTIDRSRRVLSIFVGELGERLLRLNDSITSRDAEGLRFVAHSARGSSMLVGAARLARESQQLDVEQKLSDAPDWIKAAELAATIAETIAVYEAFISSDLGGSTPVSAV